MADRKKVIAALKRCSYDPDPGQHTKEFLSCSECPYQQGCTHDLMRDALELLKEQEPRVMTPREFDGVRLSKPVWLEVNNINLLEPALFRYLRSEYGMVAFSLIENRAIERDVTGYNLGWRCWTHCPSPKQRRDTPWEVEDAGSSENNTPS